MSRLSDLVAHYFAWVGMGGGEEILVKSPAPIGLAVTLLSVCLQATFLYQSIKLSVAKQIEYIEQQRKYNNFTTTSTFATEEFETRCYL